LAAIVFAAVVTIEPEPFTAFFPFLTLFNFAQPSHGDADMTCSTSLMAAIEAALDTTIDGDEFMDHIAVRVRPEPWTLAEERV